MPEQVGALAANPCLAEDVKIIGRRLRMSQDDDRDQDGEFDAEEEEAEDRALAEAFRQKVEAYRQEHGFWPPTHKGFRQEPQIVALADHLRHRLAGSTERLNRFRELNAPDEYVGREIALQAEIMFALATVSPDDGQYDKRIKLAWKCVRDALALGAKPEED